MNKYDVVRIYKIQANCTIFWRVTIDFNYNDLNLKYNRHKDRKSTNIIRTMAIEQHANNNKEFFLNV